MTYKNDTVNSRLDVTMAIAIHMIQTRILYSEPNFKILICSDLLNADQSEQDV